MGWRALRFFGPFGVREPSGRRGVFFIFPLKSTINLHSLKQGNRKNNPRAPLGERMPKGPKNRIARRPIPPHPALAHVQR